MAGAILPIWRWQIQQDGEPVAGAKLYTWLSGTSTPQAVYADSALGSARPIPVEADADGTFPIMYMGNFAYKMEVRTSAGVTIWGPQDNIYDFSQVQFSTPDGSSLIGFIQAGSDAVATTVQAQLRLHVNPEQFGAVGNGIADDSDAVQAAVNAGTDVELSQGKTYRIGTQVVVPSGVRIFGKGKIYGLASRNIRTAPNAQYCVFEDFEIEGGPGGEFGIFLDNADYCTVRNVRAYGFSIDGIYVGPDTAHDNLIDNCIGYSNGRQGVSLAGGSYNVVRGGYYYSNGLFGVDIEGPSAEKCTVDGATCWLNENGITSDGSSGVGYNIIVNNRCYSNTNHGIQAWGPYDQVANNVCVTNGRDGIYGGKSNTRFTNNTCVGNTWHGIEFDPGANITNVTLTGNNCSGNTRSGIKGDRILYSSISFNQCWNNDALDSSTWYGISLATGLNTLIGNSCGNTTAGVGQIYGIFIGAASADNQVAHNVFYQNKTLPIRDDGGSSTFTKNEGYLNENGGTSAAIATGATIAHGLGVAPTMWNIQPLAPAGVVSSTVDATNITVTFSGGGNVAFSWTASLANSL